MRRRLLRSLALLRDSPGAKLGANDHRRMAAKSHARRFSIRLGPSSGGTGRSPATLGRCFLSSRSRVRAALGALIRIAGSDPILIFPSLIIYWPSQPCVPDPCQILTRRWPGLRHSGVPSEPDRPRHLQPFAAAHRSSACRPWPPAWCCDPSAPSARAGSHPQAAACPDRTRAIPCKVRVVTGAVR
jgi:hypothetical protein